MAKTDAYEHLDAMYQAIRALSTLEASQGTADKPEGFAEIEPILETKAHQEILVSLRALRSLLARPDLADFERNYVKCLSSVYHDPEEALSESTEEPGWGWCLFSPKAAAEVRPMLIRNVTGLYAALSDCLNPGVLRHRTMSASPADSACLVVNELCTDVFAWLQGQPSVGEESLTDWLLYALTDRLPWVRYLKFTRHEESRFSGADWEWWLLGDGQCLGMRIQAKKTRGHADLYPLLAYSSRHGLQIERLLEGARSTNLLPLYAFYDAPSPMPPVACVATSHMRPCGVFVASAQNVYKEHIANGRHRVDAHVLLGASHPLTCLFCCSQSLESTSTSYFTRVVAYIDRFCSGHIGENGEESQHVHTGIHQTPPPYIRALAEAPDPADVSWIEAEFRSALQEVSAIVAFDLRGRGPGAS